MGLFETAAVAIIGLVFAVFVLIALAAAFVVSLNFTPTDTKPIGFGLQG